MSVVWGELQVVTQVFTHIYSIFNVITVKADGTVTNGASKVVAQQSHIVVVDVHVCKHIFEHDVHDVARLNQLINAGAALSFYNVAFGLGLLAIYVLGNGFVYRHGQNKLVVIRAMFNLVEHPTPFADKATVYLRWRDVVHGQRYLLILGVLKEVVVFQSRAFLGRNHPSHQLDSRIILARILAPFLPYHHFGQLPSV